MREALGELEGAYVVGASSRILALRCNPLLSDEEHVRCIALESEDDRLDFVAARVLAKLLISHVAGEPIEKIRVRQYCETCGGPHGRAVVDSPGGYQVSWSHHRGVVAAVVAQRSVGIDVISRDSCGEALVNLIEKKSLCRAEALFKAGAGRMDELLQRDELAERSAIHFDRTNRRLRVSRWSTPRLEMCVASSASLHLLTVDSLISAPP